MTWNEAVNWIRSTGVAADIDWAMTLEVPSYTSSQPACGEGWALTQTVTCPVTLFHRWSMKELPLPGRHWKEVGRDPQ